MTRLKVAVRVRPMSQRETEIESVPVISVLNEESLEIINIKVPEQNVGDSRERVRRFTFDYCFHENSQQNYIFDKVEGVISKSLQQRNHACVLAYGQSSTGKTHTMMGVPEDPGLIPNFCNRIFGYLQETAIGEEIANMKVSISYLEIYNEKVRDLLNPSNESRNRSLKIREHPKKGPYVQGLSEHPVNTTSDLLYWLQEGNKRRKIAATHSNPQSSRSHSVFVVNCDGVKLNLIDLAGSERAASRCFNLSRFKEGSNINRSIVALGNVISALADQTYKQARGIRRRFVPFRDSILTWLLKDILGGNSNTVMVATVSPSSACYNETVNTLRFGQRAKNIIFRPVVNEDPKEKTIRELRAEIFRLKELLKNVQLPIVNQMYFQKDVTRDTQNENTEDNLNRKPNPSNVLTILTHKLNVADKPLCTNEEELIPNIDVNANINKKHSEVTLIMSSNKIDPDKCGSDDSTISSKSITSNQSSEIGSGSQTSRRSSLRTESLHKSVSLLSKTSSKRQSLRAMSSENLSKRSESKFGVSSKASPRSQVVAAVTSRLYNKVKKKEVATDTDDINTYNLSVFPKELLISENARARLRNITRRALRANRIKNQDIQTDLIPIKRMKEMSTNTSDLKVLVEELKHVATMTSQIDNKDACVDSSDLIDVTDSETVKSLLITRSCGTQFNKEDSQRKQLVVPKPSTLVSFTKYLREGKDVSADAIYTNVVNINISNNYLQGNKPSHSVSSESLENFEAQSSYMVTPDLLSNHPPLEMSSKEVQTWYHGSVGELNEEFLDCVEHFNQDYAKNNSKAKCSWIPDHSVAVPAIKMLKTHAAEIFRSSVQAKEYCIPLKDFEVVTAKPRILYCDRTEYDDVVIVHEPYILHDTTVSTDNNNPATTSNLVSSRVPKTILKNENGEAKRIVSAMSAFLEEATEIMSKLSEKEEKNHSYDLQVTVNGLKSLKNLTKKKKLTKNKILTENKEQLVNKGNQSSNCDKKYCTCFKEKGSQTILPVMYNCSTQSEPLLTELPVNKYEIPFEAACSRLEKTLSLVQISHGRTVNADEIFAEYESSHLDNDLGPNYSDYGSLPKTYKKKYRTWSLSPKSYLKQLTAMRKDIVESTRDYMRSYDSLCKKTEDNGKYSVDHIKDNT
ncbi:uncharacterized protein [Diabrotica undecimpunctata]|uniref:uncharacterized protein n=1 Tax=Diabrotica undecimpunctata TaxID=50387 RepID=UPI003B635E5E